VFFVYVGELGQGIAIPLVESVRARAGAARCDAQDGKIMLPRPGFGVLAEAEADLAIAMALFHDEAADEGMGRRLKVMLDGDFNPADDFLCDGRDESGLVFGARGKGFDPGLDVGCGALVAELFGKRGDLVSIAELDGTDDQLSEVRSGEIVHVDDLLIKINSCRSR
jgi:hypothetical protein